MQALLDALSNPGAMTGSQWLVLAIGLFIVLGSGYFVIKLFKIIQGMGRSSYTPNIGLHKHPYRGEPVNKSAADSDVVDEKAQSAEQQGAEGSESKAE